MKNRKVPYGYKFYNGIVIINNIEKNVLLRIIDSYLNGLSLQHIADELNGERIEYMPGICGWNKSRLMRMIVDIRYVGDKIYPSIISEETHEKLKCIQSSKNSQKNIDRTSDIHRLNTPVICPICGCQMRRKHVEKTVYKEKWFCKDEQCRKTIYITDKSLLERLTQLLNVVIKNPEIIKSEEDDSRFNMDVIRLDNEINLTLKKGDFDTEDVKNKIMECIALKYKALGSISAITKKLKADFEKSSPLNLFSVDFFNRTVKRILFDVNGAISIVLINGQQIGKE